MPGRKTRVGLRSFLLLILCSSLAAECLPFSDAQKHIGETRCVTGKVLNVNQGDTGVHYLAFCENYTACPFTVVVFRSDLRYIGDVRQLAGKVVQIHGPVKMYDGRAEIILRDLRQLGGDTANLPPLPKNYDVERKGRYSAGKFSHPKAARKPARKRQGAPVPTEDPSDAAGSPE